MRKIKKWQRTLCHAFLKLQATLRLRQAIQQAEEQRSKTKQRHYVLPAAPLSGTLIVFNRQTFRYYRRRHYINSTMHVRDMRNIAYYYTADGNGNDTMTPQERTQRQHAFLHWYIRCYHLKRNRQH